MQKRSHKLLAGALLQSHQGFDARRFELAFLFGSFQPDCNPLTYLKGSSFHGPKFQGHCFPSSWAYIESRIQRLQARRQWTMWNYYTLGKLTHYLADAFTYPHNEIYPDGPLNHHRYETALRLRLAEVLESRRPRLQSRCGDLTEALDTLHHQYLRGGVSGPDRDIRYILAATALLMAACCPASARAVKTV